MALEPPSEAESGEDYIGLTRKELSMDAIESVLRALDGLLEAGIQSAHAAWGASSISERFRGLYIGQTEVEHWLQCQPGAPSLGATPRASLPVQTCGPLRRLQELYSLTLFDLSVVVIALAPEVDLKYERLYAYLQDDVTRKRPTVDLALNLLSSSAAEKLDNRRNFASDAPILRRRVIHLIPDVNYAQPPLLAHYMKLDEQVLRMLLGDAGLDSRLRGFCRLEEGEMLDGAALSPSIETALSRIVKQTSGSGERRKLILHFQGASRVEMHRAAQVVANGYGSSLITADLSHVPDANLDETIELLQIEAQLKNAIPYLELDALASQSAVSRALQESSGTVIIASAEKGGHLKVAGIRTIIVHFPFLDAKGRQACWEMGMQERHVRTDPATLEGLANRFRLVPEQITQALEESCATAQWRVVSHSAELSQPFDPDPLPNELYAAARAQSGSDLAAVARKLEPIYTWNDLVLPFDTLTQLHELCQRVNRREHVLGRWGFDRKLSLGKGTSALFAGPSGTGKTMAAEVIANEVKLDLFTIDLAGVVSKYIGETEKNLDRIFAKAEGTNAILFFDEADALFGKRSEVRDSHDRYANLEISYLLQKMDAYEGVTILASNLRQHMDESFIRRLAFTVLFPFPDETYRRLIWRGIWPAETPLSEDIDFDDLASRFKLSGGNIKNIALAAAFLAAEDGAIVGTAQLLHAIEREYQKMGKTVHAKQIESDSLVTS